MKPQAEALWLTEKAPLKRAENGVRLAYFFYQPEGFSLRHLS